MKPTPRRLRGGIVKKRPLTPERFLNPPERVGCSKCRQKGCRSCRGFTLKEFARWEEEQGEREVLEAKEQEQEQEKKEQEGGLEAAALEVGEAVPAPVATTTPAAMPAARGASAETASTGTTTRARGVAEPRPAAEAATTTTKMTLPPPEGAANATKKKRPLTPERFLNPPKRVGCSKCRQKGCRRCRGYTLDEMARWQEEHGEAVAEAPASIVASKERATTTLDSKTPAVARDRAERVDDLSPAELEKRTAATNGASAEDAVAAVDVEREVAAVDVERAVATPDDGETAVEETVEKKKEEGMAQPLPMGSPIELAAEQTTTTATATTATIPAPIVIPTNDGGAKVERSSPCDEHGRNKLEAWWNPLDESIVSQAKGCLHVSYTGMTGLPSCRENQIREISDWLNARVQNTQGDSLYISGVPGTGKTLAANAIIRAAVAGMRDAPVAPPVALSINCMRVETAKDVLNRIVAGFRTAALQTITGRLGDDPLVCVPETDEGIVLEGAWADLSPEEHLRKIAHHPIMTKQQLDAAASGKKRRSSVSESDLVRQTGLIFLILDEIDGMLSGRNCEEIMGSLLALASSEGSRLVIIGIANSIDLMQQLTRPGAVFHRFNMKPKNVIFPTYLREQVSQLLQERLDALPGPVIDPKAVQFCARKIANGTGDMRRALEAASLSIDVAVKDAINANGGAKGNENTNVNGAPVAPAGVAQLSELPGLSEAPVKRTVGMRQMGLALNKLSGGVGTSNEHVKAIKKLPVPQQLIMCALSAMVGETFHARGIEDRANGSRDGQPLLGMKISHNLVSLPTYKAPESAVAAKPAVQPVTLADIEQGQRSLCGSIGVEKYTPSEFSTAVEVLETMGLIQLSSRKAADKRSRVQLKISEDDVWLALSDIPILKNILTKK